MAAVSVFEESVGSLRWEGRGVRVGTDKAVFLARPVNAQVATETRQEAIQTSTRLWAVGTSGAGER